MSTRLLRMCFTQLIEKWKACCPPQTYQHSRFPMLVKPFQANAQCSALRSWESKYQGIGPKIGYPHVESILPSVLQSAQHLPEKTQILFFFKGLVIKKCFAAKCHILHTKDLIEGLGCRLRSGDFGAPRFYQDDMESSMNQFD